MKISEDGPYIKAEVDITVLGGDLNFSDIPPRPGAFRSLAGRLTETEVTTWNRANEAPGMLETGLINPRLNIWQIHELLKSFRPRGEGPVPDYALIAGATGNIELKRQPFGYTVDYSAEASAGASFVVLFAGDLYHEEILPLEEDGPDLFTVLEEARNGQLVHAA